MPAGGGTGDGLRAAFFTAAEWRTAAVLAT
jgi:hypothetical protein